MKPPLLFFTVAETTHIEFFRSLPPSIRLGINSYYIRAYERLLHEGFALDFVDNPFLRFHEERHKRAIQRIQPQFATLRDYFSRQDCEELRIPYYSVDELLAFYEQIKSYVVFPIFIPKTLPIPALPEQFVLGFPTKSEYAKKGLHFDDVLTQNKPIHILGGSLSSEFLLWFLAPDRVISIDNNYISRQAAYRAATVLRRDLIEQQCVNLRTSAVNKRLITFVIDHFQNDDLRIRALVLLILIKSLLRRISFSTGARDRHSYWQSLNVSLQTFAELFSDPFISFFCQLTTNERILAEAWTLIQQRFSQYSFVRNQSREYVLSLFL